MKTGFRFGSGYVFTLSSRRLNIGGASRRYASVRSAPCRAIIHCGYSDGN